MAEEHTVNIDPDKCTIGCKTLAALAVECFAVNLALREDGKLLVTFDTSGDAFDYLDLYRLHLIKRNKPRKAPVRKIVTKPKPFSDGA